MEPKKHHILWCVPLVLMIVQLATVQCADPVEVTVEDIGDSVTLNCNDGSAMGDIFWTLTDNTTLNANSTNSNPSVQNQGQQLAISSVDYVHLGEYLCSFDSDAQVITVQLRERSTWELYRMNVIIGCSSAAAFLLIAICIYLVYHFRWRPQEEKGFEVEDPNQNGSPSYINIGYNDHGKNKVHPGSIDTHL